MPVDFFPLILGAMTCLGFVVGLMLSLRSRRHLRTAIVSVIFLVFPWAGIYVWLYYRADILYSSSAAKGDPEAQYRLGFAHMYYTSGAAYDPVQGAALMQRAADARNARAQMTLACFILCGLEMVPDQNRALALLDRATPSVSDAAPLAHEVRTHGFNADHPSGIAAEICNRWTSNRH